VISQQLERPGWGQKALEGEILLSNFFRSTTAMRGNAFRCFWFFDHCERVKQVRGVYPDYGIRPWRVAAAVAIRARRQTKAQPAIASTGAA